jgi:hypothetical protein
MLQYRGPYLPSRPAFLLTAELPYDDLLVSPEGLLGVPREDAPASLYPQSWFPPNRFKVPRIYFVPGSSSGWM